MDASAVALLIVGGIIALLVLLQGEGIAGEREAVARGLEKSILEIKAPFPAFPKQTCSRSSH